LETLCTWLKTQKKPPSSCNMSRSVLS